jgi:hypothetical protein
VTAVPYFIPHFGNALHASSAEHVVPHCLQEQKTISVL